MSLVLCPECSTQISATAVACPNCGRPSPVTPPSGDKVFIAEPVRETSGFPTWAFIPIGISAIVLLIVIYAVFRQSDDQGNLNVNISAARTTAPEPISETRTVAAPSSADTQPISKPGQTTTVPETSVDAPVAPPDSGKVVINARVTSPDGSPQTVRNTKFYLLDKDLETILTEARVEPVTGNSLMGSLGLTAVFPERYRDFQRAAERAISEHVKYSGTTDSGGVANLTGVTPRGYYLFGITRVGRGFALWNSSVSVIAGDNVMNLSPPSIVEIPES